MSPTLGVRLSSAAAAASDFPPIGGGGGSSNFPSLGGVGSRGGRFVVDEDARRKARDELAKMNAQFDEGLSGVEQTDQRSMMEIMQAKRLAEEKIIEAQKSKAETIEERKARLQA